MPLSYGAREDSWGSLGQQEDNQSILKKISTKQSLKGLRLKGKLKLFGHLMQRANSLEKTLKLGNIKGGRIRGWQRMRWLDGVIDSMDMSLSKFQEIAKDKEAWHTPVHWGPPHGDMTKWLNNKIYMYICMCAQSCPTLYDPMDCSPLGSSIHWIFQVGILEWVAISSPKAVSQPRDRTHVSCASCISRCIFYYLATQETVVWN